jgi:tetratricopeptide (TPR) repeat protein
VVSAGAELRSDPAVLDRRTVLRGAAAAAALVLNDAEMLRRELTDAVDHAAMSDASLDDWEHTVYRYGLAGRYRPAASQLADLTADFAELRRLLERRRAILVPTRLTKIVAQMAKLMASSLNRLDQPAAARNWARMAKHLANEAGDSQLHAQVLNEEAVTHYYDGNLVEAVYVAAHAQHIAGQAPCAGVASAAAMEARAHARLGRVKETHAALDRAERALGRMDAQALIPSILGYSEARFYFCAGNAYTHLGQTAAAFGAQERALALYPANEYLDRTLVMLDHADCLVHDNDVPAAAEYATQALLNVGANQRDPMIENRARQVLSHVSARAAGAPAVRELHDVLHNPSGR